MVQRWRWTQNYQKYIDIYKNTKREYKDTEIQMYSAVESGYLGPKAVSEVAAEIQKIQRYRNTVQCREDILVQRL